MEKEPATATSLPPETRQNWIYKVINDQNDSFFAFTAAYWPLEKEPRAQNTRNPAGGQEGT